MSESLGLGKIITAPQERDAIHIAVLPATARCALAPGQHVSVSMQGGEAIADMGGKTLGIVDPFIRHDVQRGQQFWLYLYPGSIASLRHQWTHPDLPEQAAPPLPVRQSVPNGPHWRTEKVVAICTKMLQEDRYDSLPILADALEEAGYGDDWLLALMRKYPVCFPGNQYVYAQRLVCLILSEKTENAARSIDRIAEAMDLTYGSLMNFAFSWLDRAEITTEVGGEHWRDTFPAHVEEFWKSYEIVTGTVVGDDRKEQFFTCTC